MTKQELMSYSWSRDFTYKDLLHVAGMMTDVEVPTEEEYAAFCEETTKQCLNQLSLIRADLDEISERDATRQQLGWGFVRDNGVER